MKRPENITYWVDEVPPPWISLLQGLQHISVYAISLVFPVLIVSTINASKEQAMFLVSVSMIAGGVGVILQAIKRGPMGSGFLIPQICGPSFIPSSLLAVQVGGIPLMLGMTMFAGSLEMVFSRFLRKMRALFPPEVTGTIVTMVGISVVGLAMKNFAGLGGNDTVVEPAELLVSIVTLGTMVGINVWTKGKLKMFSVLVGMVVGYVLAIFTGVISPGALAQIKNASAAWFPFTHHPGWAFRGDMVLPFGIAMICSSLKSIGDMITAQKINDRDWKRPDMENISGGILADGAGCFTAGVLGGMGQSTSSANLGLTIATGVTSRRVALWMGGLLIAGGFLPKISALFAVMPRPLMGSVLIFALSFMVVAGFQIITSRMMDARKTFVVGFSIIFGLSADLTPQIYQNVPHWIHPVVASSLSLSAVLAVLLNLVFRIGISNKESFRIQVGAGSEEIFQKMEKLGKRWGARPEIIYRSVAALDELRSLIESFPNPSQSFEVNAKFDEFNLDLTIGVPWKLPETAAGENAAPHDEIPTETSLATTMLKRIPDRISFHEDKSGTRIKIHFDH
ncbi:MAG: xanthine permease [Acidobacteria bacterium]|nr:xanthine permease [Acidobacteriota bacterium]